VDDESRRIQARYPSHRVRADLGVEDFVLVEADPGVLSVVVRNLIDNACKHTRPGTEVRVQWKSSPQARELWVEDSGDGVPQDLSTHVFDRFFRGDPSSQRGLGLGLSISQGFMQNLGGSIRHEKSELGGAAFVLSFPKEKVREAAEGNPS
jgi:signal transduction histidine kinase